MVGPHSPPPSADRRVGFRFRRPQAYAHEILWLCRKVREQRRYTDPAAPNYLAALEGCAPGGKCNWESVERQRWRWRRESFEDARRNGFQGRYKNQSDGRCQEGGPGAKLSGRPKGGEQWCMGGVCVPPPMTTPSPPVGVEFANYSHSGYETILFTIWVVV